MSCLKASAAADAVYGPGFKDLNEVQKYYVYNAPYTAAVTGEDVADIIDKLRSEYQKGHAAATGAEHASDDEDDAGAKAKWVWEGDKETGDWVWSETGE